MGSPRSGRAGGLYCPANYRTPEQLAQMHRLEAAGICLFCPEHLPEVLLATAHWSVVRNDFPYRGTALHLLLLPKEHATDLLDLAGAVRADFWTALFLVRETFALSHYGLGVRNGECERTGGTIRHVHAHVLVGDGGDEPVRMRFSSAVPR